MNIAITGGTGLLGCYLIEKLRQVSRHKILILSWRTPDRNGAVEYRVTDYSQESLLKALKDIDAVVHLAAKRGNFSKTSDYLVNAGITKQLYQACIKKKISKIIFSSSISVYSDENSLPWHENMFLKPLSAYGASKMICEFMGNLCSQKYEIPVINLRFCHLFGRAEQNDYMINRFMRLAFSKQKLVIYSDQPARREFMYTRDAAQAILCALAYHHSGTYNVGSGESFTNYQVAEIINKAFHNEAHIQVENQPVAPLSSSYMTNEKAKLELGFKPRYNFSEAMHEIYHEMLDNQPANLKQ